MLTTPTAVQPGQKYGNLTVLERVGERHTPNGKKIILWECYCLCGSFTTVAGFSLRAGDVRSCGCLRGKRFSGNDQRSGRKALRSYWVWMGMKQRCKRNFKAKNYRDRGIKVDPRWEDFDVFFKEMGECPPGLTIERKDNDKGYKPGNCIWATTKQQNRNTRKTVWVIKGGQRRCVQDWVDELEVSRDKVISWAKKGLLGFSLP